MSGYWICPDALDRLEDKIKELAGQSGICVGAVGRFGFRGDTPLLGFRDEASKIVFERDLSALAPTSAIVMWFTKRDPILTLVKQ